jgi:hypothetical protein
MYGGMAQSFTVIFLVVGQLTKQEQNLIYQMENDGVEGVAQSNNRKKQTVCVIHNLINFKEIDHVNQYLNNTIKTSSPVEQITLNKVKNEKQNRFAFQSRWASGIVHLVLAQENSPAGKYFNENTIEFLKNVINSSAQVPFDPIEKTKEHLKNYQSYLLDKPIIDNEKIITIDNNSEKLIKLEGINLNEENIRRVTMDEIGIMKVSNKIIIPYQIFKKENEFSIHIDLPGCQEYQLTRIIDSYEFDPIYFRIKLAGEITGDPDMVNYKLQHTKVFGPFNIFISVENQDAFDYKMNKKPNFDYKDGVLILSYSINI